MRTRAKKSMWICLTVLVIAVVLSVACYAYSNSFSIPTGSTTWNGKNNGVLWGFDNGSEVTWTLTNTTSSQRTLEGQIYYVVPYWPDTKVGSTLSVSGGNGANDSDTFVPYTDRGYYPVITDSSRNGSTGTVSAEQ